MSFIYSKIKPLIKASNVLKAFYSKNFDRPIREIRKSDILWFPGHINKGLDKMGQKMVDCDMLIEIHDARIPFTGRAEFIENLSQIKPRLILLNKADLVSDKCRKIITDSIMGQNHPPIKVLFTTLNDSGSHHKLLKEINETILNYLKCNTMMNIYSQIMVAGLPNVGKSTFINAIRCYNKQKYGFKKVSSKKPAKVAAFAGVTRSVSERILVHEGPPRLFIIDTPGIWEPKKLFQMTSDRALEAILKLALCGCLNWDTVKDKEAVIDYLIYRLDAMGNTRYREHYKLPVTNEPVQNILELLIEICKTQRIVNKANSNSPTVPDINGVLYAVYKDFNLGKFGKIVLDDIESNKDNEYFTNQSTLGQVISSTRSSNMTIPFKLIK